MGITKKIILLMLITSLTLGSAVFAAEPATQNSNDFEETVAILKSLGTLPADSEQTLNPDDMMTRGQFVTILVKVLGFNNMEMEQAKQIFTDVPEGTQLFNDIFIAVNMGIVNGNSDGTFGPNDPIRYGQVVKMLTTVLGYSAYVGQDSYPLGYLLVANSIGITKQVSGIGAEDQVTVSNALKLVRNAIDIDVLGQSKFGDKIEYSVQKGKTLLSEKLSIYKFSAVMEDNGETRLIGESKCSSNTVKIGDEIYNIGNTKPIQYLGYYVEGYAKFDKDTNDYTLLYINAKRGKNQVLTIQAEDLLKSNKFTVKNIVYSDSTSKEINLSLNEDVDVIYNGKACLNFNVSTLQPEDGNITLIDNDNDDLYDVVLINKYDSYFVSGVDVANSIVYDKYGRNIDLSTNNSSTKLFLFNPEGIALKVGDIQISDVLSVRKSLDGKIIKADVTSDVVKGTVDEITKNDLYTEFVVEGIKYKQSVNYQKLSGPYVRTINVGDSVTFYLDVQGKIVAVDALASNGIKYAYMVKAKESSSVSKDFIEIRLMLPDGKFYNFKSTKKVTLNGANNQTECNEALKTFKDSSGYFKPQLIKYRLNSKGDINSIFTSVLSAAKVQDSLVSETADKQFYKFESEIYGGIYAVAPNTIAYFVPDAVMGVIDEDLMSVASVNANYKLWGYNDSAVRLYDVDDAQVVAVVVCTTPTPGNFVNYTTELILVQKVTKIIDKNGEEAYKLTGYYKAALTEFTLKNINFYKLVGGKDGAIVKTLLDVREGDILRLGYDLSGVYKQGQFLCSLAGEKVIGRMIVSGYETDTFPSLYLLGGMLRGIKSPWYSLETTAGYYVPNKFEGATVYTFDSQRPAGQRISIGTLGELVASGKDQKDGSNLLLYNSSWSVKTIYNIK